MKTLKHLTKLVLVVGLMCSGIFITSSKTEAAVGGWYKVTAGGTDCKARVYTDRTEYGKTHKYVNAKIETQGNCSRLYYDMGLSHARLNSSFHDITSGYFSSSTPLKSLEIKQTMGGETENTFVYVQLFKNAAHTELAGELFSTNLTVHPR
ncbi:hypothetical protein P4J24_29115 [Bacillus anthracis]|nr:MULTISPECIES: hypothetical protein [Bacillus cereus group]MDA2519452.1 hypothetical protein [Bacillus cereus]MEB9685883.1 hypothetical protein [Bacillus anthracis]